MSRRAPAVVGPILIYGLCWRGWCGRGGRLHNRRRFRERSLHFRRGSRWGRKWCSYRSCHDSHGRSGYDPIRSPCGSVRATCVRVSSRRPLRRPVCGCGRPRRGRWSDVVVRRPRSVNLRRSSWRRRHRKPSRRLDCKAIRGRLGVEISCGVHRKDRRRTQCDETVGYLLMRVAVGHCGIITREYSDSSVATLLPCFRSVCFSLRDIVGRIKCQWSTR